MHLSATLHGFARTEAASVVDLRRAAAGTNDVARRALYLKHAMDEARHAFVFAILADELRAREGLAALGHPRPAPDDLYDRLGEADFLAVVHRGERRGRKQFETLIARAAVIREPKVRAALAAILEDERRHESYTRETLVALAGEAGARRALAKAAAWEVWRAFRRLGRGMAERLWALLVIVLFLTLLPLTWFARQKTKGGWITPRAK
jgi:rubrerythrin